MTPEPNSVEARWSASSETASDCVRLVTFDRENENKEIRFFYDREWLCNANEFFRSALSGVWAESQDKTRKKEDADDATTERHQNRDAVPISTITFPQDKPEIVKSALWYLDDVFVLPAKGTVMELCRFADRLGIKGLIQKCDIHLAKEADSADALEYLNFAEAQNLPKTYHSSSVGLLTQQLIGSDADVTTSLSPETIQKFKIHRRIFQTAIAQITFGSLRSAPSGGYYEYESNPLRGMMLALLSLALLADVSNISRLNTELPDFKLDYSLTSAMAWLKKVGRRQEILMLVQYMSANQSEHQLMPAQMLPALGQNHGISLDRVPPTPDWARESAIQPLGGEFFRRLLGKHSDANDFLSSMATQIHEAVGDTDDG
ncbi:unnamed protein product [Sympodiomycopsis kandeliae]